MSVAAALLLALGQAAAAGPSLHEAPAVELWCPEDWPVTRLQAAARGPRVTLGISTRSNMLPPAVVAVLERSGRVAVRLSPELVPAHLPALRRLPLATLVFALPERPGPELRSTFERLGPQTLRLEIARLDAERAAWLAGLKNAEVELDVRRRLPDTEELARLRSLTRLRPVVRLSSTAPPELVQALSATRPVRLVVESGDAPLPSELVTALVEAGLPTRIRTALPVKSANLLALAGLTNLSLELVLTTPEQLPPTLETLRSLSP